MVEVAAAPGSGDRRRQAMAIRQGVTDCWRESLEDDGTVVVLCVA